MRCYSSNLWIMLEHWSKCKWGESIRSHSGQTAKAPQSFLPEKGEGRREDHLALSPFVAFYFLVLSRLLNHICRPERILIDSISISTTADVTLHGVASGQQQPGSFEILPNSTGKFDADLALTLAGEAGQGRRRECFGKI